MSRAFNGFAISGSKVTALLALCALGPMLLPAEVANWKLNSPLVPGRDVSSFQISPDGAWVVYLADQDTSGAEELYSVPIRGGTPIRLTGYLPAGCAVEGYEISANSKWVVYRAPQDNPTVMELYSVPIGGPAGAAIKLNRPLVAGGEVGSSESSGFDISPDSARVVYVADQETHNVLEIYSVPIRGPASSGVKLNRTLLSCAGVFDRPDFLISRNGRRVVYDANQESDNVFQIYSVPIEGPATAGVKLNGAMVAGGGVSWYAISPDSQRVVYTASQLASGVYEIFSVPVVGPNSAGVRLNGPLPTGGDIVDFQISPNSSRVVYCGDQDADDIFGLYGVPIVGPWSARVKLSGVIPPFKDSWGWFSFDITPNGQRVLYLAGLPESAVHLYSVGIGGGAATRLNPSLVSGGAVLYFQISPDSRWAVYKADQETNERFEMYCVPTNGPSTLAIKISRTLGSLGDVMFFRIAPDSSRVAYLADPFSFMHPDDIVRLYGVAIRGPGSSSLQLNGTLVDGGDVRTFDFAPNPHYVVYIADQDTDEVDELYVAYDNRTAARGWEKYR
jgi:Tol biopolymer transport system component